MKEKLGKLLIHITIALILISSYLLFGYESCLLKWIILCFTIFCILLCLIYFKKIKIISKKISFDRYISLISLEIALFVFIQTGVQERKNNEQFERNRIASDSLFRTQLSHSEKLNQSQIENSKSLNGSLISELNKIQDINLNQSLASKNQLNATQKQLELSQQTLTDYINETKSNLVLNFIKIEKQDTIDDKKVKLSISSSVQNIGKRDASDVEFRNIIVLKNRSTTDINISKDATFLTVNTPTLVTYYPTIPLDDLEDFYYWLQIKYYDVRLDEYFDRSYYRHYYKTAKGFDFYYANNEIIPELRKIIDEQIRN